MTAYLQPSECVDSDHPAVRAYAERAIDGATDQHEQIRRLFATVRDSIRYDPFNFSQDRADYRASAVAGVDSAFCIPKAILFTAGARSLGIPARMAFADVRNHLQPEGLREKMGTDLFLWHGYSELLVDGVWRKASPAFNRELCARFGVEALDFDGTADAILHPYNGGGARYMEYVTDRGSFEDFPFEEFLADVVAAYPAMAG
ncbi:MAG: hypothetical protein QOF76_148 [Solirubrobacteraceae bacterium]|jgi:transglutaminase-like putative cysteine protease|nr:hypothetical protein [Solirubrobacteraceae bacterium]